MTFKEAKAKLKEHGVTLTHNTEYDEYRVNILSGREETAYYTTINLEDAFYTGLSMAELYQAETK